MSPRTQTQYKKIRENKKELIRSKALKLFAESGYHTTTISKIAREAEISKGLIYNYFDSKEQLLKEIMTAGLNKLKAMADPDHDGVITGEKLILMMQFIKEMLSKEKRFWSLYFSIFTQPGVMLIVRKEIDELYNKLLEMFIDYFQREGYEDPETEALILGSLLDGVSFNYLYNPKKYPIDKVMNRLIQLYRNKLTK